MAHERKDTIILPTGADQELLKRYHQQGMEARSRHFEASHKAFIQNAEMRAKGLSPLVEGLGLKREDAVKRLAEIRKTNHDTIRKEKPTAHEPLRGHNPVRYAPFDFQWDSINCGGITYCSLYGPDAASGQTGADLAIFNGGGAGASSAVGFWYYAQTSGTLYVTVYADVWGRGYIFSGLFGYASAYAGLRVWVEQYAPFNVWSAGTDIYNNSGVLAFDITTFDWVWYSVGISVPVTAGNWYEIWGGTAQSAYAGGLADSVSNFEMYIAPVVYFEA